MRLLMGVWLSSSQLKDYHGFLDDITILLVFFIILNPILVYLIWNIIQRRIKYIKENSIDAHKLLNSIYTREISIRFLIQDLLEAKRKGSSESEIEVIMIRIKIGLKNLREDYKTCKLVSILEFLYTFYILEDEDLARLKLSFTMDGDFDFEYNYGEFRCRRLADDTSKQYSEELDFIKYRRMYEDVMRLDEKACNIQLEFWNELGNDMMNVKKLESLSYSIHRILEETHRKAKELYKAYPENGAAVFLYGSFLKDIYNNTVKGNELIIKSENVKKVNKIKEQIESRFSYFYENTGILIVSGNPNSIGMLEYSNTEANNILGLNADSNLNLNISSLLPAVNDYKLHDRVITRFINHREATDVGLDANNFLMSCDKFLIEVYIQVKCLAWDSYPFFLVSLRRSKNIRECILLDTQNCIIAHTKNCNSMIRFSESNFLIGMRINQLIPGIIDHIENLGQETLFEYDSLYERIYIKLEEKSFKSVNFRVLYLTNYMHEVKSWSSSKKEIARTLNIGSNILHKTITQSFIRLGSLFKYSNGILKRPNLFYIKKNLKVRIDDKPSIYLLPWTDFKPSSSKKAKDATTLEGIQRKQTLNSLNIELVHHSTTTNHSEVLEIRLLNSNGTPKPDIGIASNSSHSSKASSSIKAQRLITSVNISIKRFKIAFFLTNLLVISAIAAMITYLIIWVRAYKDDTLIFHVCSLRSSTVTLTENVRYLQIQGLINQDPDIDQLFRTKLAKTIEEFDNHITSLEEKLRKRKEIGSDSLYKKTIPTFIKEDTQYILKRETLIDALRNLNLESKVILSTPAQYINSTNPHYYYIIRNGVEETAKSLNETVSSIIKDEEENLAYIIGIVDIMVGAEALLIVLCFICVILPTIIRVEKANQDVWAFFYKLDIQVVNDMKTKFEERLETLHSKDQVKQARTVKFKNIELRAKTRSTSRWKNIILKLGIYYALSAGIFIYLYFFLFAELTLVISQKPEVLNWGNMIITSLEEGFFWGTEVSYFNTNFGYFSIVPEQQASCPTKRLYDSIHICDYSEKILINKFNLSIKSSTEQQNLLFEDGCFYTLCDINLKKGLHVAIMNIKGELPSLVKSPLPFPAVMQVMELKEQIKKVMSYLMTLYEDILNDMIENCVRKLEGVVISYCILAIALYIFLYLPLINQIKAEVTSVWGNTKLISSSMIMDHQEGNL